jgi:hemoglobin/transferrin/lactoferrin receptor protein
VLIGLAVPAEAIEGRVVDKSGQAVAGATITVVGTSGAVVTDADGRFTWIPDPKPPFTVIVVLPGGRVARPVVVDRVDPGTTLSLVIDAAVSEELTVVAGVAPSIEATPGAATTLVSSRDLALRMPANLLQAIDQVPGVNQVSEGQAAVPALRGLARGRTLILIDGGRVNSERRVGPSATFMDPAVVDGIDIARGPGSVAYGSDAFGGVISVRTLRPAYAGWQARGGVTVGGGIPDRRVDGLVTKGFGTGGLLVSIHGRNVEDYDGPDGTILNSGYSDRGGLVRLEQQAGGGILSVAWQGDFGRDIERPRNNSTAVRFYYPFENSHRVTASFTRVDLGGLSLLEVSGFVGTFDQRTDQDRIPTPTRPRDIGRADLSATDVQVRMSAERAVGKGKVEFGGDVNGRVGLEAHEVIVLFDLAGRQTAFDDTLSVDSASRVDTGLFLQGEAPLGATLSAAGGVRVDRVTHVNEGGFFGDRSIANGAIAGFAAISAGPFDHLTLTAQIARGFRDPTLSDRFFRGPSGRGFITGNPDLEPERSVQVDVGARYATSRTVFAVYGYRYDIRNLVERFAIDEPDSFAFRNRGRARVKGFEAEAQASVGGGLWVEFAAQIGRGTALDDDGDLDDISPDTVSVGVRKAVTEALLGFVRVTKSADDGRPGPSEIAAPGHTNLDFGATWMPHRRLEVRGLMRNALNQAYYASPDPRFVLAPGINGAVTVVVKY